MSTITQLSIFINNEPGAIANISKTSCFCLIFWLYWSSRWYTKDHITYKSCCTKP